MNGRGSFISQGEKVVCSDFGDLEESKNGMHELYSLHGLSRLFIVALPVI